MDGQVTACSIVRLSCHPDVSCRLTVLSVRVIGVNVVWCMAVWLISMIGVIIMPFVTAVTVFLIIMTALIVITFFMVIVVIIHHLEHSVDLRSAQRTIPVHVIHVKHHLHHSLNEFFFGCLVLGMGFILVVVVMPQAHHFGKLLK